ncbi:MAG TPA: hypothetical protein VKB19_11215 [Pedobacter sp.]|nr:hypothetical protein [Pedobacter sp.]
MNMINPGEKDDQAQNANDERVKQQSKDIEDVNWDKNQQIDEEGNEVDPEDIK